MKKKVVLDTNILLSAFLGNGPIKKDLDKVIRRDFFTFYYSDELFEEYTDVISRKKFEGKIDLDGAGLFLTAFKTIAIKFDISKEVAICRDKNDDFILSLCMSCEADFLITGDQDLLTIGQLGKTKIVRLPDFCQQNGLITIIEGSRKKS
jgi:putative PIN family toxin of toxin-antitoxin system